MPRFVILHHTVGPALERTQRSHFDWMFETGDRLTTFSTTVIDLLAEWSRPDQLVHEYRAERLADHRIEYLEYEGELAAGRGMVRRVIAGQFESVRSDSDSFIAELSWKTAATEIAGGVRRGEAAFYRSCPDSPRLSVNREEWRLRWSPCR